MRICVDVPWNRLGLIAELADRFHGVSPQFGKTALEKMAYFLQELYGIGIGYDFSLYTYGPFTSQLLHDLDFAEALGAVRVECVNSEIGGYTISAAPTASIVMGRAREFLGRQDVQAAITRLVEDFGGYSAKDLELRSTIVYIDRDALRRGCALNRDALADMVRDIKPYFSVGEILGAINELMVKGHFRNLGDDSSRMNEHP